MSTASSTNGASPESNVADNAKYDSVEIHGLYFMVENVGMLVLIVVLVLFVRWNRRRRSGKFGAPLQGRVRFAAAKGEAGVLQGLKEKFGSFFDVESPSFGFTALHAASVKGEAGAVLWLCQNGANVHATKDDGWGHTALHMAAARGHLLVVKVLLAFGADMGKMNYQGYNAAQLAVSHGRQQVASFLSQCALSGDAVGRSFYQGKRYAKIENEWILLHGPVEAETDLSEWLEPAFDGAGTPGTRLPRSVHVYRILAVEAQLVTFGYLVWRALRTFNKGASFVYSAFFWECEFIMAVVAISFFMSMWFKIERPMRRLPDLLEDDDFPKVDAIIVTYSEPVEVVEATVIAALNMDYPGDKLAVLVCDDGGREAFREMVNRIRRQLKYMERKCRIKYVSRDKVKGVDHHAKAGNINNCLMFDSTADADYLLVLDCDMIVHPSFLLQTLGHMYEKKGERWKKKRFASLLQTPQDFWNIAPNDPLVNGARFFYGPMLQGRDGIGACPCCGTGVLFLRDALISIGGQPTSSITEDYFCAMQLIASNFTTMYLNERLMHGMAPDDVGFQIRRHSHLAESKMMFSCPLVLFHSFILVTVQIQAVFSQRLRWAVGALQIMFLDNPLLKPGLGFAQSILFWEASFQYFLSYCTLMLAVAPIVYLYFGLAPVLLKRLWEFCAAFVHLLWK